MKKGTHGTLRLVEEKTMTQDVYKREVAHSSNGLTFRRITFWNKKEGRHHRKKEEEQERHMNMKKTRTSPIGMKLRAHRQR